MRFKNIIWAADLAKMGWLSYRNWGVIYLLCAIDVFTKYTCVKPLKEKKVKAVLHGFIETVYESKCKQNNLWVGQGKEFYNSQWLDDNDILMYSIHNESKSAVAERFIRTLKGKIYKKMVPNNSKFFPWLFE